MRAGQLDVMIAIQRATVTQSPSGEPISAWSTLAERPAMLTVQTGYERLTTDQLVARAQVAFSIRWSSIVDNVSPLDRIIYPLSALDRFAQRSYAQHDLRYYFCRAYRTQCWIEDYRRRQTR